VKWAALQLSDVLSGWVAVQWGAAELSGMC